MRGALAPLVGLLLGGCGVILDFEDVEGLPCPCEDDFVCLEASDRCVPAGRTEPFKSCPTDTPLGGDELCPANHRCVAVNGQGPRCLPQCEPVLYARPQAGRLVGETCPLFGTTCWATEKGGVCSEGVCEDNPNTCPAGERCVRFNGAGVCFTECQIYDENPLPCGSDQICHPIGEAQVVACVDAGNLPAGAPCTRPADGMCQKTDGIGRPLICARAAASSNDQLFCRPRCNPADNTGCLPGETCPLVRANIYPSTGIGLGACEGS